MPILGKRQQSPSSISELRLPVVRPQHWASVVIDDTKAAGVLAILMDDSLYLVQWHFDHYHQHGGRYLGTLLKTTPQCLNATWLLLPHAIRPYGTSRRYNPTVDRFYHLHICGYLAVVWSRSPTTPQQPGSCPRRIGVLTL